MGSWGSPFREVVLGTHLSIACLSAFDHDALIPLETRVAGSRRGGLTYIIFSEEMAVWYTRPHYQTMALLGNGDTAKYGSWRIRLALFPEVRNWG